MDAAPRTAPTLPLRRLIIGLAAYVALTAVGGGLALLISRDGAAWAPLELLAPTRFQSFLVPGLVLALVVGGSSLACTFFAWRRSRAAIDATVIAGGALTLWIITETAQLRTFHVLQAVYGLLGLSLLALGLNAAWRSPWPRHRWVISVTLAETFGFFLPALAIAVFARSALAPELHEAILWAALLGLAVIGLVEWLELRTGVVRPIRWLAWVLLAGAVATPLSLLPHALLDEASPVGNQIALWASVGMLMAYVMAQVTWQGLRRLRPPGALA